MEYPKYTQQQLNQMTPDQLFHALNDVVPHPKATRISDHNCPNDMVKGDVVYVAAGVKFYSEKEMKVGTAVKFTRYGYSHYHGLDIPIWKYAFFRFPDGSERSLMKTSFTRYNPRYNPRSIKGHIWSMYERSKKWLMQSHGLSKSPQRCVL